MSMMFTRALEAFQEVRINNKNYLLDFEPVLGPEEEQLKKFGAFCRTQRQGKTYNYAVPMTCAIGQWYKSMGYVYMNPYGNGLLEYFAKIKPHTYGALADRIEHASSIDFACARHYG